MVFSVTTIRPLLPIPGLAGSFALAPRPLLTRQLALKTGHGLPSPVASPVHQIPSVSVPVYPAAFIRPTLWVSAKDYVARHLPRRSTVAQILLMACPVFGVVGGGGGGGRVAPAHSLPPEQKQRLAELGRSVQSCLRLYQLPDIQLLLERDCEDPEFKEAAQEFRTQLLNLRDVLVQFDFEAEMGGLSPKHLESGRTLESLRDAVLSNPYATSRFSVPPVIAATQPVYARLANYGADKKRVLAALRDWEGLSNSSEPERNFMARLKVSARQILDVLDVLNDRLATYDRLAGIHLASPSSGTLDKILVQGKELQALSRALEVGDDGSPQLFATLDRAYEEWLLNHQNRLTPLMGILSQLKEEIGRVNEQGGTPGMIRWQIQSRSLEKLKLKQWMALANGQNPVWPGLHQDFISLRLQVPEASRMQVWQFLSQAMPATGDGPRIASTPVLTSLVIETPARPSTCEESFRVTINIVFHQTTRVEVAEAFDLADELAETRAAGRALFLEDLTALIKELGRDIPRGLVNLLSQLPTLDKVSSSRQESSSGRVMDEKISGWMESVFKKIPRAKQIDIVMVVAKLHEQALLGIKAQLIQNKTARGYDGLREEWRQKKAVIEKLYTAFEDQADIGPLVSFLRTSVETEGCMVEAALHKGDGAQLSAGAERAQFMLDSGREIGMNFSRTLVGREVLCWIENHLAPVFTERGATQSFLPPERGVTLPVHSIKVLQQAVWPPDPFKDPLLKACLDFLGWTLKVTPRSTGGELVRIISTDFVGSTK